MPGPPATPMVPSLIDAALVDLSSDYSDNCELVPLPRRSAKPPGVEVRCIRIHQENAAPKDPAVLIVGGVHGREMAPPDALVRLATGLLEAYKNKADVNFPPLTARASTSAGLVTVSYPAYRIPYTQVRDIIHNVDLYLIPCINPDGRLYDITTPAVPFGWGWRKNRRPNPDNADVKAIGVDLNRNFDVAWDYHKYYDMPMYHTIYPSDPASTLDRDEVFNGVTDAVRTVTVIGSPTGGTFELSFNGRTTTAIAFDAAAATVQTRLTALTTIGAGNVTVAGTAGGPYTVTFTGARAHPVGMITADFSALTGGTEPRVVVDHARPTCEPETENVQWLINTKKIRFFLDVHQDGRTILVPWGLEDSGGDPAMTYLQAGWDGKRDGLLPAEVPAPRQDYQEYLPDDFPYYLTKKLQEIATAMRDAILTAAGADLTAAAGVDPKKDHSLYTVGSSARFYDHVPGSPVRGGPLTGASDDYAFSRQFEDPSRAPVYAYTIEVGQDEELGFHPDYTAPNNHYPKIEREVHAASIAFLAAAARWCRFCVVATAVYGSADHPDVAFLRHVRDRELRTTALGRRFLAVAEGVYYSFSPALAGYLHHHRRAAAVARAAVVRPAVRLVRAAYRATSWLRPRGLRVATLTVLLTLGVAAVAAVAVLGVAALVRGGV